ncbi:hypothetical protein OQA88_270 [Cercophora sp. LCS_1]
MASFFGDLYTKLFPTRASQPSAHSPPTFLISPPNMTSPTNGAGYSPLSESAIVDSPSSAGGESGYFPTSPRSSMSSTISAQSDLIKSVTAAAPKPAVTQTETAVAAPVLSQPKPVKVDAMLRNYPKPTKEPVLEELLAQKPHKWAVGHWVQHARKPRERESDKQAELRRAKEELLKLAVGRP